MILKFFTKPNWRLVVNLTMDKICLTIKVTKCYDALKFQQNGPKNPHSIQSIIIYGLVLIWWRTNEYFFVVALLTLTTLFQTGKLVDTENVRTTRDIFRNKTIQSLKLHFVLNSSSWMSIGIRCTGIRVRCMTAMTCFYEVLST